MKLTKYFISAFFLALSISSFSKSVIELKVQKNEKDWEHKFIHIYKQSFFKDSLVAKFSFKDSTYYVNVDNKELTYYNLYVDGHNYQLMIAPDDTVKMVLNWTITKVWAGSWFASTEHLMNYEEGTINWLNDSLDKLSVYQGGIIYGKPRKLILRRKNRPRYTGWKYAEPKEPVAIQGYKIDSSVAAIDKTLIELRDRFADNRFASQIIDWNEYKLKHGPYGKWKEIDEGSLLTSFVNASDTIPNYFVFIHATWNAFDYKNTFFREREKKEGIKKHLPILHKHNLDKLLDTKLSENETFESLQKIILIYHVAHSWFYWDFNTLRVKLNKYENKGNEYVRDLYKVVSDKIDEETKLRQFNRDSFIFRTIDGDTFRLNDHKGRYVYVFGENYYEERKQIRKMLKLYEEYGDSILFINAIKNREKGDIPNYLIKPNRNVNWITLYSTNLVSESKSSSWSRGIWMNSYVNKEFDDWEPFINSIIVSISHSFLISPDGYLLYPNCGNWNYGNSPKDVFEVIFGKPN